MSARKVVILTLAAFAGAAILAVVLVNRSTSEKETRANGIWADLTGPLDDIPKRFPAADANDKAHELETLADRMGIELRPRTERDFQRPRTPYDGVKEELFGYVRAEMNRAESPAEAPPPVVEKFLNDHESDFTAIAASLAHGEAPRWPLDLRKLNEAPIPNLLGHISLQRTLLASALVRSRERNAGAGALLEASWRLNESIRTRPEVISQLIVLPVARMQLAVLRKLENVDAVWRKRLTERDDRKGILAAFAAEAWRSQEAFRLGAIDPGSRKGVGPAVAFISRPLTRSWAARYSEMMAGLAKAASSSPVGDGDGQALIKSVVSEEKRGARWNAGETIALIGFPNLANAWKRVDRLIIESELTDKVLEARSLRSPDGAWPQSIAGIETSKVTGAKWVYVVLPDGSVSISFSRELQWSSFPKDDRAQPRFVSRAK